MSTGPNPERSPDPRLPAVTPRVEETLTVDSSTQSDVPVKSAISAAPTVRRFGRFELLDEPPQGAAASQCRAVHSKLKKPVVLHFIDAVRLASPESAERFRRRISAICRLASPHLVRCDGLGKEDETTYVVAEHTPGASLKGLAQRVGPLPVADACQMIGQAALGLQHAYEAGLAHGAISSDCLLLAPSGTVKIAGLGLADDGRSVSDQIADDLAVLCRLLKTLTDVGHVSNVPHVSGPFQAPIELVQSLVPLSEGCDLAALLRRAGIEPQVAANDDPGPHTREYLQAAALEPRPQIVVVEQPATAAVETKQPARRPARRPSARSGIIVGLLTFLLVAAAAKVFYERQKSASVAVASAAARAPSPPSPSGPAHIDLLPLIDPVRDAVNGEARREGQSLIFAASSDSARPERAVLQLPLVPPEAYTLRINVERVEGVAAFGVGLTVGKSRLMGMFDWPLSNNDVASTLAYVQGNQNLNTKPHLGRVLPSQEQVELAFVVENGGIEVLRNGASLLKWEATAMPASIYTEAEAFYPDLLFLDSHRSAFRITALSLTTPSAPPQGLDLSSPEATPERLAAERVLWKGGAVRLWTEEGLSETIERLEQLGPDPRLAEVIERDKRGVALTDADLPLLAKAANLQALSLSQSGITDEGLAPLASMTSLRTLTLNQMRLTNAGLKHLSGLRDLENLYLKGNSQVSDAGMAHLAALTRLRRLQLSSTSVGDAGVESLAPALGNVRYLCLCGTPASGMALMSLRRSTFLEELHLGNTPVDDAHLATLYSLPNLKTIRAVKSQISQRGKEALQRYFPKLEYAP